MTLYQIGWAAIILYCMIMYVVLDGFTLGAGIMMPFLPEKSADIAMSTLLPTWDGNQTWLVLGLASLYGAYPDAFSLLMPALYLPLLIMGIALLFRGVVFEFRLKSSHGKYRWSVLLSVAALTCTAMQGAILGAFIQGFTLNHSQSSIISLQLFSPFNAFTAISLVVGYLLLGSTRLILKTTGVLRHMMYRVASILTVLLAICVTVVSIWTPFLNLSIKSRWFDLNLWPFLVLMPATMLIAFSILVVSLVKRNDNLPYWSAVIMFLCPYAGFAASVYPYIVPYHLAFWNATSGNSSLKFMFFGACVLLPTLTSYTYYSYYVFRGKVNEVLHY